MSATWSFLRRGKLHQLKLPAVMGVINCTPDSFFEGSRTLHDPEVVWNKVREMKAAGVDIIDLGAESTRPGAAPVSPEEEIQRLIPAIQRVREEDQDILISADTRHAKVARAAWEAGADIINDISAGASEGMWAFVASQRVPYILMHMRGTPDHMNKLTQYEDVTAEVIYYLAQKVRELRQLGVTDLVVDPGFGFAKTIEQNYELLNRLQGLKMLDVPLLIGISRKSMIYKKLDIGPEDALNGTSVLHAAILQKVQPILRVHDVKEAREVIRLTELQKKSVR